MSKLDPNKLRRELLLEQMIKVRLDHLVEQATAGALVLAHMNSKLEKSQLRNLVNVANESDSVQVVANFIRYQIARKSADWGTGENDFGHHIIKNLYGNIEQLTQEVLNDMRAELSRIAEAEIAKKTEEVELKLQNDLQAVESMQNVAYTRLMKLYLGYLNRAFYYYDGMDDKKEAIKMLERVAKRGEVTHDN